MLNTYAHVIDWLLQVPSQDRIQADDNLQKLTALIASAPWRPTAPIITITGTNGKGTCVQTLTTILSQAGYRVASFTSPHLQHFNERIAINGKAISDADFLQAAQVIYTLQNQLSPHFFSLLLLMALWYFAQQKIDVLILEVGVGGRLDPCNAVNAASVGITSIALDHQHLLGTNRTLIGTEKAGLMRKNQSVFCGDSRPPASITAYAKHIGANLKKINQDFSCIDNGDGTFYWQGTQWLLPDLTKPALVLSNIAVALAILEALHDRLPVPLTAIRTGLQQLHLAGRYQTFKHKANTFIIDIAHNPTAIKNLVKQLKKDWPHRTIHLVFGMMADKDWSACFELLSQLNLTHCYFPTIDDPRALIPDLLAAKCLLKNIPYQQNHFITETLDAACLAAHANDIILVTGSFRLVGACIDYLK